MTDQGSEGLVVRVTGHEVWVVVDGRTVPCVLRGRLRQERRLQVVAGDRVTITPPPSSGEAGAIESINPRDSYLSRYVERASGERGIVANVEMLFVVATLVSPPVQYAFVDRVLVSAERGLVPASVILNKLDLVEEADADDFRAVYEACGYPVLFTSAVTGRGVDELSSRIGHGTYAFFGASGVGKTSLLNRLDPRLDLRTRGLGEKTGKGRHTTTSSQLYPFRDGYLADTPGVQTFGFPGEDRTALAGCFPELRDFEGTCRFHPCTHSHEPGCRVREAVDGGVVPESRYQSYLLILGEIDERRKRSGR